MIGDLPGLPQFGTSVDEQHIGLFPKDFLCRLKRLGVWLDESTTNLSLEDFLQRFHTIKILLIGGDDGVYGDTVEKVENGMKAIIRGINQCRDLKQV